MQRELKYSCYFILWKSGMSPSSMDHLSLHRLNIPTIGTSFSTYQQESRVGQWTKLDAIYKLYSFQNTPLRIKPATIVRDNWNLNFIRKPCSHVFQFLIFKMAGIALLSSERSKVMYATHSMSETTIDQFERDVFIKDISLKKTLILNFTVVKQIVETSEIPWLH